MCTPLVDPHYWDLGQPDLDGVVRAECRKCHEVRMLDSYGVLAAREKKARTGKRRRQAVALTTHYGLVPRIQRHVMHAKGELPC